MLELSFSSKNYLIPAILAATYDSGKEELQCELSDASLQILHKKTTSPSFRVSSVFN